MSDVLIATEPWRREHVGGAAAVVAYENVRSITDTPALAVLKLTLVADLIARFGTASRAEMVADPVLAAYERYDRRFGQNYHVAMQIRSIAQKGKTIPARNVILEAMFMTELATGVLAAAQDLDVITLPIEIDSTDGSESYERYDGVTETCKTGDQVMRDAKGHILTSIAQGPTSFGLVTQQTTKVAYCFYFPEGVPHDARTAALNHLDQCVLAGNPAAQNMASVVIEAG
jgi:DNA/RNA-binding domain of Phe-tRNA-synthetase-like protein